MQPCTDYSVSTQCFTLLLMMVMVHEIPCVFLERIVLWAVCSQSINLAHTGHAWRKYAVAIEYKVETIVLYLGLHRYSCDSEPSKAALNIFIWMIRILTLITSFNVHLYAITLVTAIFCLLAWGRPDPKDRYSSLLATGLLTPLIH